MLPDCRRFSSKKRVPCATTLSHGRPGVRIQAVRLGSFLPNMNWYYAKDGQQTGPVDDTELSRLVASGGIQASTLVWREGLAQWQAYQEIWAPGMPDWRNTTANAPATSVPNSPAAASTTAPVSTGPQCILCRNTFAEEDLVSIEGRRVCAVCKPTLLQNLKEGGNLSSGSSGMTELDPEALIQAAKRRTRPLSATDCLTRGWDLFRAQPGFAIAAVVIVFAIMFVGGMIPILSFIIGFVINGPLMGGLWLAFIRALRNEEVSPGDVFAGFSKKSWLSLIVVNLLTTLLTILAFAPGLIPLLYLVTTGRMTNPSPSEIALMASALLLFIPVIIYLSLAWFFAVPLVIDRGYGPWESMTTSMRIVNRNLGGLLLLGLLAFACYLAGFLALCIGILVAAPVIGGAMAAAYEELFGSRVNDP